MLLSLSIKQAKLLIDLAIRPGVESGQQQAELLGPVGLFQVTDLITQGAQIGGHFLQEGLSFCRHPLGDLLLQIKGLRSFRDKASLGQDGPDQQQGTNSQTNEYDRQSNSKAVPHKAFFLPASVTNYPAQPQPAWLGLKSSLYHFALGG